MTIILLDPQRPDLIPSKARALLEGTVAVTEDVPAAILWTLDRVELATEGQGAGSSTLVSTDPQHPLVAARIAAGEQVIGATVPAGSALLTAVALMDTLRRNGPWESEQTHDSLRRYLLEEVYELLDAIDAGSEADIREELGDLLLQVLFHARIGADRVEDRFDIDDVARDFVAKVSGRSPGVLAGGPVDLAAQIREWEERKAAEKNRDSVLDGIATTQPALALTQKVLERLSAADFPEELIDADILTVTVRTGADSVEAQARRRTLDFMDRVRSAEARAAEHGLSLDSQQAWLTCWEPVAAD